MRPDRLGNTYGATSDPCPRCGRVARLLSRSTVVVQRETENELWDAAFDEDDSDPFADQFEPQSVIWICGTCVNDELQREALRQPPVPLDEWVFARRR